MLWIPYTGTSCAFMWYSQYGFRPYFLAIMKYPDEVERLYSYSGDLVRLKNRALAEAITNNGFPPYVYFGEDICYNRGPMVPVDLLREIYFPHLRRSIEPLKEAGLKIVWHSDGNIMPILDDLLDSGVDGFQGFQQDTGPTLEHFANLKSRSGDKLILWGSVSVTKTLPFGTVADVEREVESCIDAAHEGGGFFLAPSSSVGPEVPDANILAMHRHAVEYGSRIRSG
jgi:uroporphyrinogen decarboxylase